MCDWAIDLLFVISSRVPHNPVVSLTMQLNLNHIGQIALAVGDVDRAEAFFGGKLGLRKLYRFGDLSFFDCAGVRLMLEKARDPDEVRRSSVIYFRCAAIVLAVPPFQDRGPSVPGKADKIDE